MKLNRGNSIQHIFSIGQRLECWVVQDAYKMFSELNMFARYSCHQSNGNRSNEQQGPGTVLLACYGNLRFIPELI